MFSKNAAHRLGARPTVFVYNVAALIGLGLLAIYYFNHASIHGLLPDRLQGVPVYAVWFGALGGVAISLKGCYDHRLDWTDDWSLWHYGRVLSGALAGGVTYILLLAVNLKSGTEGQGPAAPIVAAASFILGTQEKRFFDFLVEVGKLIVTVPASDQAPAPPSISGVSPSSGTIDQAIVISGAGFKPQSRAYLGGIELNDLKVDDAGAKITGKAPNHAPGKVAVIVSNPDNSALLLVDGYTYTEPSPPAAVKHSSLLDRIRKLFQKRSS